MLGTVTLAIGLASGSALLGLSVAFGAFLAGLAVSESEYGYQSLAEIIPLRDAFATLFFVGMGMVIDPDLASAELETVAVVVFAIVVGKALLATIAVRASGLSPQTAVQTGLLLAQVGEFSFVIARGALDVEVIRRVADLRLPRGGGDLDSPEPFPGAADAATAGALRADAPRATGDARGGTAARRPRRR